MSIFKSLIKSCIFLVFLSNYIYCTDFTGTKKEDLEYVDVNIDKTVKVQEETKGKKKKTVTNIYTLALFLYKEKSEKKKKEEYEKITKIPKFFYNYIKNEIEFLNKNIDENKVYTEAELYNLVREKCKLLSYYGKDKIVIDSFRICFVNEKEENKKIDTNIINFITSKFTNIKDKNFKNMEVKFNDSLITDIVNLKFIKKITIIVNDGSNYIQFHVNPDEFIKTFEYSYEIDKPKCYESLGIDEDTFINIIDNFIKEKYEVEDIYNIKILNYNICPDLEVKELDFKIFIDKIEAKFEDEKIKIKICCRVRIDEDTREKRLYPIYYESLFSKINFENLNLNNNFECIGKDECDKIFQLLNDDKFIKTVQSINTKNIKKYHQFYRSLIEFFKKFIIFEKNELKSIFKEEAIFDFFTIMKNKKLEFKSIDDSIDNSIYDYLLENSIEKLKDFGYFIYIKDGKCIVVALKNKDDLEKKLIEFSDKNLKIDDKKESFKNFYSDIVSDFEKEYGYEKGSNFRNKKEKLLKEYLEDILKKSTKYSSFVNVEAFIEYFDFSEYYLDYISYYCINILEKDNINSKEKEKLIKFLKEIDIKNKTEEDVKLIKDVYIKKIKENLNDNSIDDKYYESFKTNKLQDLFKEISEEPLKTLSVIFVDEIIKNEKENVIGKFSKDNIATYIKNLQDKKVEYNAKTDEGKYKSIEQLLNNKNISEGNIEIRYEDEHINKIITELNKEINNKLEANKKTIISTFIESEKTKINTFKDLNDLNNYLTNFNKGINEDGSLKKLLKQYLIGNNFKEDDIKDKDYKSLATLTTCIDTKQKEINEEMEKQMDEDNKKKLKTIQDKIIEIYDKIIKEIEEITKREDIKNYKYKDNDSITNHINEELVKIADYNTFIKQKIGKTDQTYEVSINTTIGTKVTEIKNKYDERNDILSIVNIEYTLSDDDKITDEGKLEFKKLTDEKYKKFDSRKTYKELFETLKSVSAYFKNIDLVDSSTLISIENKDEVIDKDDIIINIKLVDSCYKKEKPKEEHEEDKNKDKHKDDDPNKDDPKNPKDNENNGGNNSEINESVDSQIKENNRCCKCCNNKNKNSKNKDNKNNKNDKSNKKTCCAKKV